MLVELEPIVEATRNKLQITIDYQKETTGENVVHTGGVYEIGTSKGGKPCIWLWDLERNDHIRCFLLDNITRVQVLDASFVPTAFPIKINGEIVG